MDMVAELVGTGAGWHHRAACLDEDPELFFPVGTSPEAVEQTREAKIVCDGCPVRVECLAWALALGEQGVWGGTTDDERAALRAAAARPAGVAA